VSAEYETKPNFVFAGVRVIGRPGEIDNVAVQDSPPRVRYRYRVIKARRLTRQETREQEEDEKPVIRLFRFVANPDSSSSDTEGTKEIIRSPPPSMRKQGAEELLPSPPPRRTRDKNKEILPSPPRSMRAHREENAEEILPTPRSTRAQSNANAVSPRSSPRRIRAELSAKGDLKITFVSVRSTRSSQPEPESPWRNSRKRTPR
jgi:hypothetical protein